MSPGGADSDVARRLGELREELRTGRDRLLELEAEAQRVRDTMLRIEGAIMALEELEGAAADRSAPQEGE
jgi:hypothetical protein